MKITGQNVTITVDTGKLPITIEKFQEKLRENVLGKAQGWTVNVNTAPYDDRIKHVTLTPPPGRNIIIANQDWERLYRYAIDIAVKDLEAGIEQIGWETIFQDDAPKTKKKKLKRKK